MFDLVITAGTVIDGTGAPAQTADVAIQEGRIVEVGRVSGPARRKIDADGLHVTPGWIDAHTHYDGQATWDPILDPSFSSGVTTAIMGNCGVGFAPVRRGMEQHLIDLMEGVEEIPGTALHAGLKWNWSSFTEYLDVLDSTPRTFDVGALLPHGPLRLWAMGEKVGSDKCAADDELRMMTEAVDAAMRAGAFGIATSRTSIHRTVNGEMTPDYRTDIAELKALAAVVARHGGIFEVAPDGLVGEGLDELKSEMRLYEEILSDTKVNMHILLFQTEAYPEYFHEQLAHIRRLDGRDSRVTAQFSGRTSGALLSFFGGHPFLDRPTMTKIQQLPMAEWLHELAKPEVKRRILSERSTGGFGEFLNSYWHRLYDLGADRNYEPDSSCSIATLAHKSAQDPAALTYDLLLQYSEQPRIYAAITNYANENLDIVRDTLLDPSVILGLSDAGAHVLSVCDSSIHSFMLAHWTRDRTRGPRLPIEQAVNLMSLKTAASLGLDDRGALLPGMKADINILDHAALKLEDPRFFDDLPTGARRVMQKVSGYRATIVSGTPTREYDEPTGELPGKLVRWHGRNNRARASD